MCWLSQLWTSKWFFSLGTWAKISRKHRAAEIEEVNLGDEAFTVCDKYFQPPNDVFKRGVAKEFQINPAKTRATWRRSNWRIYSNWFRVLRQGASQRSASQEKKRRFRRMFWSSPINSYSKTMKKLSGSSSQTKASSMNKLIATVADKWDDRWALVNCFKKEKRILYVQIDKHNIYLVKIRRLTDIKLDNYFSDSFLVLWKPVKTSSSRWDSWM